MRHGEPIYQKIHRFEHQVKIARQAANSGSPGVSPDGTNTDGAPLRAVTSKGREISVNDTANPLPRSRDGYLTAAAVGLLNGVADRIRSRAVPPTAAAAVPLETAIVDLFSAATARIEAKTARIKAKTARIIAVATPRT
ncbi:MAG: hypothetical protein M1840_005365 [Geoglossum simile]|nr:MAG: hypothetical protein M1840_005365 [Geoglossum simile]